MNEAPAPLSVYLQGMLKENLLINGEALLVARLPEELQERAVELSEKQRTPHMEQIVSQLLNPNAPTKPARARRQSTSWKDHVGGFLFALMLALMLAAFISGARDVGKFLWDVASALEGGTVDLYQSVTYNLRLESEPVSWSLPFPIITDAWNVQDNKVLLRWKPVGANYTYRIYRGDGDGNWVVYNPEWRWRRNGAVMDASTVGKTTTYLAVTTLSDDGRMESPLSMTIRMNVKGHHHRDALEPAPPGHPSPHAWGR